MPCYSLLLLAASAAAQIVITLENTDPSLHFEPDVCDTSSQGPACPATWQIVPLAGSSSGTVTTTSGPRNATLSIIPQLFLNLRGTSFTLHTSSVSNATANITLTASPSGTTLLTSFDSSLGAVSAVNLPPDEDMTVAVTYVAPGRLDIDSFTIQADNDSVTSLSSVPGPTSSALPSFSFPGPTASNTPSSSRSHLAQPVGTIVGETLAAFFGLILLGFAAAYAFIFWRNRRRKLQSAPQAGGGGGGAPAGSPEIMDVEMEDMSTGGPRAI